MVTAIRRSVLATRIRASTRPFLPRSSVGRYSTTPPSPPPHPQRQPSTRAGTFYRSFGSPILKCFLGALFTYQVTYWGWMKLESLEEVQDKEVDEIEGLKDELRDLLRKKAEAERLLADHNEEKDVVVEEKGAKKGWGLW
ncbi:hypothetical protein K491DRAFT_330740 [Lophiostoma macrostomum CBS 122681]|uniref:Uncharacterized protein n=1 Tax=Lophiostoma macrostomum CBS 122681 TaxID=1314788 RepID=A0A6A6TC28_9PLEO|nr:hypothetical protein K491DRAFT_330740 [Lophiostoma macrostomum CBS 122681]